MVLTLLHCMWKTNLQFYPVKTDYKLDECFDIIGFRMIDKDYDDSGVAVYDIIETDKINNACKFKPVYRSEAK